jgi:outer membrane protein assembly factor BamA
MTPAALLVAAVLARQAPVPASQDRTTAAAAAGTIAGIQIRGNHTTPDETVIRIAGVEVGQAFSPDVLSAARDRLERSGRFRSVQVLQRYASISDLSAVLVVIVVEEQAGISVDEPSPGPLRKLRAGTMWLPVLRYEDGYGFTYGARVTFVGVLGPRSHVSAPLTWGGERRAVGEFERTFERGPVTRLAATAGVWRRENPAVDTGDRRDGVTVLAERAFTPWLRAGATASTAGVHFGDAQDTMRTAGVQATLDTRLDPAFPRNAIYASVGWERLWFDESADTSRVTTDVRGYLGVFRQIVLAARVQQQRAADALPVFEQPLLGGTASLRGFPLGFRYGDRLAAGSLELRMPVSSPRHVGRAGLAIFADSGAVYDTHTSVSHARFDTGVGAGWFLQLPVLSFRLDVAHGLGGGTRAHVTLGTTF